MPHSPDTNAVREAPPYGRPGITLTFGVTASSADTSLAFGRTVADARGLLGQAHGVLVRIVVDLTDAGHANGDDMLLWTVEAFAHELRNRRADEAMPCELMTVCGVPYLLIAGSRAIYNARGLS